MKEIKRIKQYLKKQPKDFFSKEQILLFSNKGLILQSIKKISPLSFFRKIDTTLEENMQKNNFKITKNDLKSHIKKYKDKKILFENVTYLLVKKLGEIIEYEEKKQEDYQKIKSTLCLLEYEQKTSINKYYDINNNLKPHSLFYFVKEIEERKDKTKLLDVIDRTLSLQGKKIDLLLKEHTEKVYQNIVLIRNILESLSHINNTSYLPSSIKTYKKSYTRPTYPLYYNLLSNKNYTIFLDNFGNSISKYKDITLFQENKNTFQIQDIENNLTYSLQTYDNQCQYKHTFNEGVARYTKKYDDFSIKTSISVSQEDDLELRKYTIKNTHYATKNFSIHLVLPIIFFNNTNYKYNKTIKNIKYFTRFQSFIAYEEEVDLYFITKFLNIKSLSYERDNQKIIAHFTIQLKSNEEKTFSLLHFIANSRENIYRLQKKYQEQKNAFDLFFKANILKNDISYKDFILYHEFLNIIIQADKKFDSYKDTYLLTHSLSIYDLWKYQIAGNYKILLVDIFKGYHYKALDEIMTFYNYLKTNGFYIDIIFLYEEVRTEKEIRGLEKYFNLLNGQRKTPGNPFLINKKKLNEREKHHLLLFADISIELKDQYNLKTVINALKRESRKQKILSPFALFLESEKRVKEEAISDSNVLEEDLNPVSKEKLVEKEQITTPCNLFLNNSYGGFDLENNEYILIKNSFTWHSILSNSYFYSITSSKNRSDLNSCDYLITKETENFNELLIDYSPILFQKVHFGFGYFIFEHKDAEKEITLTKFISTIDNLLFNKFDIHNTSNKKITLNLSLLLCPLLGLCENEEKYIITEYDNKNNLLKMKNKLTGHQMFISATNPFKKVSFNEFTEKIVEFKISLEKEEKKSFAILLGINPRHSYFLEESEEIYNRNILLLKEKYANISVVENSLHLTKVHFKDYLNILQINTGDKLFDLMSKWQIYEILIFNGYERKSLLEHTHLNTLNDLLNDSLNLLFILPDYSKKNIIKCLEHSTSQGEVLSSWNTLKNIGVIEKEPTKILLLLYSIQKYLEVTEDFSILSEKIYYIITSQDANKEVYFKNTKNKDFLFNHLEQIVYSVSNQKESFSKIITYQILILFLHITKHYNKNKDMRIYRKRLEELEKEVLKKENTIEDLYKILFDVKIEIDRSTIDKVRTSNNKILKICTLVKLKKTDEAWELYKNMNYLLRTSTKKRMEKYKMEPFLSLDNTLYYVVGIELFLGIKKYGKKIMITPNLPSCIPSYEIYYKYYSTIYEIKVIKSKTKNYIEIDQERCEYISLKNDYKKHKVEVYYKEKSCS